MESKKINQLATEMSPSSSDLTIIGDPITGVSKKVTLLQIADIFQTTGTVTSVGITETGNALTITGSPITSSGDINIGFAGSASQYVRGDGALADFPTSTGGGSSVSYYLNSSVSQGTIGGNAYRQLSKSPIIGAGTDITISANGYIANYITDANDPSLLEVPGGNFNCELYFSVNSNNHNPYVYAELYKYDGTNFTLLGSSQAIPEYLTAGTTLSSYYFAIPVSTASLNITDRLAFRIYANVDTRVVTLHTENSHLCQVITTFSNGLTSLNNLTRQVQYFGIGTSGTDFNISSATSTHTFNLPTASATNRGALSSTDWSTFNNKQDALTNPITGTGTSGQVSYFNGTSSITGNNNFFWDTTNSRLGIGLNNPQRVLEIYSATADSHLRLSGAAPTVSMGEAITGSVYQAKFGLVTANGQFYTGAVAGDFVIISQTGSTIWGNSGGERMRLNTNGTVSIGNTNNTFKLDVTGTGRFTGQLTLGSTITNGTYTYTLPSATGTLALTSDLSSYVPTSRTVSTTSPLSGGGALSSDLTLSISQASGSVNGYLSSTDWTTFNSKQTQINGTGFVKASGTTISYDNSTYLTTSAASSTYLPLAGGTLTGALGGTSATFSSSVTAASDYINGTIADNGTGRFRGSFTSVNTSSSLAKVQFGGGEGSQFRSYMEAKQIWGGTFTNNELAFVVNQGGVGSVEALTIKGNGNVGIGTTAPAAKLHVKGGDFTIYGYFDTPTSGYGFIGFLTNGTAYGYLGQASALIGGGSDTDFTLRSQNNLLFLSGGGTERMRITSGGNVGIGTSSPLQALGTTLTVQGTVVCNASVSGGNYNENIRANRAGNGYSAIAMGGANGSTAGTGTGVWTLVAPPVAESYRFYFDYNGTSVVSFSTGGTITASGNIIAGQINSGALGTGAVYSSSGALTNTNPSDRRLKENIIPIVYGLNEILQLNPVSFDWKNDKNKNKQFGFIAQEVQEVMPEAIIEGEYLGLEKDAIYTALINAIKELKAEIDELKNK
jgi:hypothetical protein